MVRVGALGIQGRNNGLSQTDWKRDKDWSEAFVDGIRAARGGKTGAQRGIWRPETEQTVIRGRTHGGQSQNREKSGRRRDMWQSEAERGVIRRRMERGQRRDESR